MTESGKGAEEGERKMNRQINDGMTHQSPPHCAFVAKQNSPMRNGDAIKGLSIVKIKSSGDSNRYAGTIKRKRGLAEWPAHDRFAWQPFMSWAANPQVVFESRH